MANIIQQFKNANGDNIYPVAYAQGGMKMDLLWANPSPTSAFGAQTVSIDTNDYEMVLVSFRASTETGYDYHVSVLVPVKDVIFLAITTGNNRLRERKFTWTAGGLIFQNAYTYNSYASTPSVDNTVLAPYQIHGIKMSYIVPTNVHGIQYVEV